MDAYINNVLNASGNETGEELIEKLNSLIYVYELIVNNSNNMDVVGIAQKRKANIEAHYKYIDVNNYNAIGNSDNGLDKHYNNAISILSRGLNEFNCSNAMRELIESIKEDPHNILYQTIIQVISDAERSTS